MIALMVSAILDLSAPEQRLLACTFPGSDPAQEAISLQVEALPSLRDNGHLFRVRLPSRPDGRVSRPGPAH